MIDIEHLLPDLQSLQEHQLSSIDVLHTLRHAIKDLHEENMRLTQERDHWKANHDNAVAIKRAVLDRPDLKERAQLVEALVAECAALRARHSGCQGSVCSAANASVTPVVCPDDACDLENGTRTWEEIARANKARVDDLSQRLATAQSERDTEADEVVHLCKECAKLADLALANDACAEKQTAIEKFLASEQEADAEIARLKADLAAMTERAQAAEAEAKKWKDGPQGYGINDLRNAIASLPNGERWVELLNSISGREVERREEVVRERDAARAKATAAKADISKAIDLMVAAHKQGKNNGYWHLPAFDALDEFCRAAGVEVEGA